MTQTESIITAARRYLTEQFAYWAAKYSSQKTESGIPYTYTDTDYNLFPRYNVLRAILDRVEMLVGQYHLEPDDCKEQLRQAGSTASDIFTGGQQNAISLQTMEVERIKFIRFIDDLDAEALRLVEPLPHRRRLSEVESREVRAQLQEHWNFQGNYWEPLEKLSPRPVKFILKEHISAGDYSTITTALRKMAAPMVLEITEDRRDAEIAFSLFDPDCYETIYCDRTYEWIIYGSHESTLAFGGNKLVEFVQQLFRDRTEFLNKWI